MKRILLAVALLGLMGVGMGSAMSREIAPQDPWGACRWYCLSTGKSFPTSAECGAACGGSANCDQIC
jgi:hypothetical protein